LFALVVVEVVLVAVVLATELLVAILHLEAQLLLMVAEERLRVALVVLAVLVQP
jgi:hypothetical protein